MFSKGSNVVIGKPVTASFSLIDPGRQFSAITDGRNLYGNILPIRDWMDQLARRHNLESERPLIVAELNHRYARQKTILKWMGWLAALLTTGFAVTIIIARKQQKRKIAEIRERFAADLHDELGENLHTIRLLGDVALNVLDASVVTGMGCGGAAWAKRELGWDRTTVRKGLHELESGVVCFDNVGLRGRKGFCRKVTTT